MIKPVLLAAVALLSFNIFAADADMNRFPAPYLPDWWKVGAEVRGRAEGRESFSGIAGQDEDYYLSRVRLNSTFTVRSWLHVFAQVQDSRAPGYDRSPMPCSITNTVDLRQAYVDIGIFGEQSWALRAGRQPLIFGDMRLLSTSNWGNVGPAYDGVRLTHKTQRTRLDWFSTLVVIPVQGFDRSRMDKKLSGFHGTFEFPVQRASLDLYSFWKANQKAVDERGIAGDLSVFTYGLRSTGKLHQGFDYNVEVALQRGHIATTPLTAWIGHWEIGRVLHLRKAPRAWMEYNFASGDSNPHDGRRQTFDQLYPSPLSAVGRAGEFASRNLHEPILAIEWQLYQRWKFRGTYRHFWLADVHDGLYNLSGSVFAQNPSAIHKHVGSESGVWAICQATRRLQIWVGYANLTPGSYLKETGRTSTIRYPYAMWTYTVI